MFLEGAVLNRELMMGMGIDELRKGEASFAKYG